MQQSVLVLISFFASLPVFWVATQFRHSGFKINVNVIDIKLVDNVPSEALLLISNKSLWPNTISFISENGIAKVSKDGSSKKFEPIYLKPMEATTLTVNISMLTSLDEFYIHHINGTVKVEI